MIRPEAPAPRLVSPKAAAARLSVSLRTMRSMIASRAIPVVRVSPRRLGIYEADLAAYVAARREMRTRPAAGRSCGVAAASTDAPSIERGGRYDAARCTAERSGCPRGPEGVIAHGLGRDPTAHKEYRPMSKRTQKTTKPAKALRAPKSPTAPNPSPFVTDERLPKPGATITRKYRGKTLTVEVLGTGFPFQGRAYRSLSRLAREVTGAKSINGFLFWKLNPEARTAAKSQGSRTGKGKAKKAATDGGTPAAKEGAR